MLHYLSGLRAKTLLDVARRNGVAIPKSDVCEECGGPPTGAHGLHGHHDDYNEPLKLRWLCVKCHRGWHGRNCAKPMPLESLPWQHQQRVRWAESQPASEAVLARTRNSSAA